MQMSSRVGQATDFTILWPSAEGVKTIPLSSSTKEVRMTHAVIIDAVRTPIGRAHAEKGMFREVRADDLSAHILDSLIKRTKLPPELVEDIHWGCVKQQGEQGYDVARQAVLIAGLPLEVCGATVNRNCGSGLQAIHQAAQSILAGCEAVQIAGGVE